GGNIPLGDNGAPAPEAIPQAATLTPGEQAMVQYEQDAGNIPKPAPPAPQPTPAQKFGNKLSGPQVDAIAETIAKLPEEQRNAAIEEAHQNLTRWIAENGGRVYVDGKIHMAKPDAADGLAAKIINDAVTSHDKQTEAAQKEQEKQTAAQNGKPRAAKPQAKAAAATNEGQVQPANGNAPQGQPQATTVAPVSGRAPAAAKMTADTPAVENVVENANIHPGQQPAIMQKQEPAKTADELAEPAKPATDSQIAKIGTEDKSSDRPILQPSKDVMENNRLAGQAAPELATKLSHIAAQIPGA